LSEGGVAEEKRGREMRCANVVNELFSTYTVDVDRNQIRYRREEKRREEKRFQVKMKMRIKGGPNKRDNIPIQFIPFRQYSINSCSRYIHHMFWCMSYNWEGEGD
jgi:hypothetical protein